MILRVFINALGTSPSDDNTDDPREGNGDDRCRTRDREQARVVLSQECAETTKNGDLDDEEPYSQDPGSTAVQQVDSASTSQKDNGSCGAGQTTESGSQMGSDANRRHRSDKKPTCSGPDQAASVNA